MIIAESFAWAHLPKAGGTATQAMLTAVDGLIDQADPTDSNDKHDPFWKREDAIAGKLLAMNIRRLPSWVLSAAHARAKDGLWPDFEPLPMPSVGAMIESTSPDDMLRWMTDGPRFTVDRWLRTEHLTGDVVALLDEVGTLTPQARAAIDAVPYLAKGYDHDITSTFSPADVRRMYLRNPGWAKAEWAAYGGIHEHAHA